MKEAIMWCGGIAMMGTVYAVGYYTVRSIDRQSKYLGGHSPWPRCAAKAEAKLTDIVCKMLLLAVIFLTPMAAQVSMPLTSTYVTPNGKFQISTTVASLRETFRGGLPVNAPNIQLFQVYAVSQVEGKLPDECHLIYRTKSGLVSTKAKGGNIGLFQFQLPSDGEVLYVSVSSREVDQ